MVARVTLSLGRIGGSIGLVNFAADVRLTYWMAEARQLKAGRWRIYLGPNQNLVRDPSTGQIATFNSLGAARQWWARLHPNSAPLREANKCARCGGYFGTAAESVASGGQYYHYGHRPDVEQRLRA